MNLLEYQFLWYVIILRIILYSVASASEPTHASASPASTGCGRDRVQDSEPARAQAGIRVSVGQTSTGCGKDAKQRTRMTTSNITQWDHETVDLWASAFEAAFDGFIFPREKVAGKKHIVYFGCNNSGGDNQQAVTTSRCQS